ncbi:MAG TPA: DNA repair protein RadC [Desulfosporosinus sp.]|nr:DNA repair protein RadC [Desulfosporosinus sp.]
MGKSNTQIGFGFALDASYDIKPKRSYFELVREELSFYGMDSAGVKDLLAIITGSRAESNICQELALLPLERLLTMSAVELQQLGVTGSAATRLEATFRLLKKLKNAPEGKKGSCVNTSCEVAKELAFIVNEEQEHLVVLLLDTKNNLKKTVVVSKGTINRSLVHPREVFKIAIRESACSIILGHNHPTGDPTPSNEDIEVTRRLSEVGKTIGIELLDHIIVGSKGYKSLKEMGVI